MPGPSRPASVCPGSGTCHTRDVQLSTGGAGIQPLFCEIVRQAELREGGLAPRLFFPVSQRSRGPCPRRMRRQRTRRRPRRPARFPWTGRREFPSNGVPSDLIPGSRRGPAPRASTETIADRPRTGNRPIRSTLARLWQQRSIAVVKSKTSVERGAELGAGSSGLVRASHPTLRAPCSVLPAPGSGRQPCNRDEDFGGVKGLGNVIVHPRRQTTLAIAFMARAVMAMIGTRPRWPDPAVPPPRADGSGCRQSVHYRHLHVHEDRVVPVCSNIPRAC